jgi:hypothetical protein
MSYKDWDTAELVKQLKVLGFPQYCRQFQANEISGLHLPALNEEHLKEMGIPSVGHRVLMLRRFMDIIKGNAARPALAQSDAPAPKRIELQPKKTDPPTADAPKPQVVLAQKQLHSARPSDATVKPNQLPAAKQPQKVAIESAPNSVQAAAKPVAACDQTTCQFCGRKFPPDAAKRHIPVCERFNAGRAKKK